MKNNQILQLISFLLNIVFSFNYSFSSFFLQKIKTLLFLGVILFSSVNGFAQNTSLISNCGDFVSGPTAWPYVLVATTPDSGVASQGAQTFTMNVTDTANGASFRVAKTTANGNWYFGPAIAITLGSNTITVAAVTFDRAVKFQFSSGDVEFDALSLNGVDSDCVANTTAVEMPKYNIFLNVFPNPSNGELVVESNDLIESLEIKDLSGRVVLKMEPQKNKVHMQILQLKDSVYFISCLIKKEWLSRKIILNQR